MSCKNECNSCGGCIELLVSIVLGAVVGVLFAFEFIPNITVAVFTVLGLGVLSLVFLMVALFLLNNNQAGCGGFKCICRNLKFWLAGTIGTIILALVAVSISLVPTFWPAIVIVSLLAFFFALMIISIVSFVLCVDCEVCNKR